MNITSLQRRRMLLAISHIALASSLAACSDGDSAGSAAAPVAETDAALLAAVAFDLFPFAELPAALYAQVGERLAAAGSPAVAEGLVQLRAAAGETPWLELEESSRLAALTALQATPFFAAARATALEVLFRAPETFALLSYGGSAIEQGGYIERGFADISWLPAQP